MPRLSANQPCPCGSGRRAKGCCGPVLDGDPAPTPEALMRSRFTAYATGAVGHLMRTCAPEGPHFSADAAAWRADLTVWCDAVTFDGLTVLASSEDGERGTVTFHARLHRGVEDLSFGETSRFVKRDGRWLYVDGDITPGGAS